MKPFNPFRKGTVSHAGWAVLSTRAGARLPLADLAERLSERVGYEVSYQQAAKLRSRVRLGDRTHGRKLDLPDLRFKN